MRMRTPLERTSQGPARLRGVIVAIGSLLLLFGIVAGAVGSGRVSPLDEALLLAFRQSGNPALPAGPSWLPSAMRDVTSLGSYAVLGGGTLAVAGYFLLLGRLREAVWVLGAMTGGAGLFNLAKSAIDRPRPDLPLAEVFGASFPSGHAVMTAVAGLTWVAFLWDARPARRLRIYFVSLAFALILLVGLSRIYLGVHYPSDVLAGWLLGLAWGLACVAVAKRPEPKPPGERPVT